MKRQQSFSTIDVTSRILVWLSRLGFLYLFLFSTVVFLTALFIIIPSVKNDNAFALMFHCFASTYFFLGMFCNCCMLYKENSFINPSDCDYYYSSSNTNSGWIECKKCNILAPPRSHHCILCQRCVLTREHHCFFIGFCVGQRNLRYYLTFCYYCSLGCLYALFLVLSYISKEYFGPFSLRILHFFLPLTFLEAIFGFQTWGFAYFVLLLYVTTTGTLGAATAFLWHFGLALMGKTSYEYHTGLPGQSRGYLKNLKLVFGDFWIINFIFPIPLLSNQLSISSVKLI